MVNGWQSQKLKYEWILSLDWDKHQTSWKFDLFILSTTRKFDWHKLATSHSLSKNHTTRPNTYSWMRSFISLF